MKFSISKTLRSMLYTLSLRAGFTLVELIVVIAILGLLVLGVILTFNPVTQYNKAKDGQREHDLQQMQSALDTYYNDTHCYPIQLSDLGTQYIHQLPTDPDGTKSYIYQVDNTSTCPQWNVLYAALKAPEVAQSPCALVVRNQSGTACLPQNYTTSGYNYCVLSGTIDCSFIAASTITSSSGNNNGGGGGGGGNPPTTTPTPTPYGVNCPGRNYYACTGNDSCNSISPSTQCLGQGGTLQCYCTSDCSIEVNGQSVKQCAH